PKKFRKETTLGNFNPERYKSQPWLSYEIRTSSPGLQESTRSSSRVTQKVFRHPQMSADTSEYRKIIAITEAYLSKWLSRRVKEDASVSEAELREQARVIYSAVFKESVGWLANFKKQCQVKLAKYHCKIACADISGVDSFPAIAKQIVEDGGYSYEQIYNCDETVFYCKKSPTTSTCTKQRNKQKAPNSQGIDSVCYSLAMLSDIESEDENESVTLKPSATPGPSSATPAHILTIKQFWKKFNIHNAVDTMADSWHEINVPTITHAWTPLFPHLKVECGGASGAQQLDNGSLLA
ncbi:Tigger transposable element-derived protein 1-like 134, partial [Homarus americanus]